MSRSTSGRAECGQCWPARDSGSTLVLILVLIVIAGLLIVPTLTYAVTVLRYNDALSASTADAEAAKAGLRVALGDPRSLYDSCIVATPVELNVPQLDVATTTTCELLEEVTRYQASELPWDVATTWYGVAPPPDAVLEGQAFKISDLSGYTDWQHYATASRIAAPSAAGYEGERSIWLPTLATRTVTQRAGGGFAMPVGEFNAKYPTCTVYFPGTYRDPVTVSGPTYFTSGVYYFESTLTIGGGASVVIGSGQHQGCTDDQRAAFSAIGVPSTHNITGVGATLVFGADGRIDIADEASGPVEFLMNARYVAPDDVALLPSEEVSIIAVNGTADAAGDGVALDIPGGLSVPAAVVGVPTPYLATVDGYQPSTLVPVPALPNAPTNPSVATFDGAVTVSWQPTADDSLAFVTGYTASVRSAVDPATVFTCDAPPYRSSCAIIGVTNGETYEVDVVANSESGPSAASVAVSAQPDVTDPPLALPDAPTPAPSIEVFDDAVRVEWSPPAADGGAPVVGYTVEIPAVYDVDNNLIYPAATCTSDGEFDECATAIGVADPDMVASSSGIAVRVRAETVFGDRWSDDVPVTVVRRSGTDYTPPTSPAPATPVQSEPILRIATSGAQSVSVDIPGYVAVPQAWIQIERAAGTGGALRVDGALLAAWIAIDGCDPSVCVIGQGNEPTQRVVRIRTTVGGGGRTRSDAVVQINSNGAWAVNSWAVQREFSTG